MGMMVKMGVWCAAGGRGAWPEDFGVMRAVVRGDECKRDDRQGMIGARRQLEGAAEGDDATMDVLGFGSNK